ncbi:SPOSA6832_03196, partial [Sporobolomyces salmonicolor]
SSSTLTLHLLQLYDLLLKVPPGKVSTYGQLASLLSSSPRAAFCLAIAVGTALRNNPFAPTVPCHRIIASTGYVGGFSGEWTKGKGKMKGREIEQGPKVTEKLELLKSEGVKFDARGQLKDKGCLWEGL